MSYISITVFQLILVSLLMLINILLSLVMRLGLVKSYLVAIFRMTVQLILVGYVLEWVFAREDPWTIIGMTLIMTTAAGSAAIRRVDWRFPGILLNCMVSILFSSYLVTGLAVVGIIGVEPWYKPQYIIPMLGMVLGNTLNGISLGLDRFLTELGDKRGQIETRLALGASAWEAAWDAIRQAMRTAMTPMLNSMMVIGLVSLPGMMTGQILAGASPIDAVRYQLVIMFMIASGTALGSLGTIVLAYEKLFNSHHQLERTQLKRIKK